MTNKNYTTRGNIEAYIGSGKIDASLDMYIESAQEYIDKYTGRSFIVSDEDEIRYFNGKNSRGLFIDPAISITEVAVSYDEGLNFNIVDNYITEPLNSLPVVKITLRDDYFPEGLMSVRITGKFGWGETIPKDITYVATVLASGMYKGKNTEEVASERIGDYSVNYRGSDGKIGNLKSILNKYKILV